MKRFKIVGLCLVAVFAISAVASASAMASEFEIEGSPLGGTESITGKQLSSQELASSGLKLTITCTKVTVSGGKIEVGGKSKATLEYTGCTANPAACKIKEPIIAKVNDQLEGTPVKDKFFEEEIENAKKEKEKVPFTEITVTGCAAEGKYKVKGSQVCALPEGGVSKIEHTLECTTSGSALTIGSFAATYKGNAEVTLSGSNVGKKWSAK